MTHSKNLGCQLCKACEEKNSLEVYSILAQIDSAFEHCDILKNTYHVHDDLMKDVKKDIVNWEDAFESAARGGDLKIVKLIAQRARPLRRDQWYKVLECGCEKRNWDIIFLAIQNGADNYDECLEVACVCGHLDVVQFLVKKGCEDLEFGMASACEHGHLEVVEYLIGQGAADWAQSFEYACFGGHLNIVELILKHGKFQQCKKKFQTIFQCACGHGHLHIIQYLVNLMVTHHMSLDIDLAMKKAIKACHGHIVRFLTQYSFPDNQSLFYCNWLDVLWQVCAQEDRESIRCIIATKYLHRQIWNHFMSYHYEDRPEGQVFAPIGHSQSYIIKIPLMKLTALLLDGGAQGISINEENVSVFLNRGVLNKELSNESMITNQQVFLKHHKRKQQQKYVSFICNKYLNIHLLKIYALPCVSFE